MPPHEIGSPQMVGQVDDEGKRGKLEIDQGCSQGGDDKTCPLTPPTPPHPLLQEPNPLQTHHILAFCLVDLVATMLMGASVTVAYEYTQVYGVGLFYQSIASLLISPAAAYAGLSMAYISDSLNSPRFGRRKPFIAPLLLAKLFGYAMFLTPVAWQEAYLSVPLWYLTSTAIISISASAYGTVKLGWLYELTSTDAQRTRLFAATGIADGIGGMGGLLISSFAPLYCRQVSLALVVGYFLTTLYLLWVVPQRHTERTHREPFIPSLRSFMLNRAFVFLFGLTLIKGLPHGLESGAAKYADQQIFNVSFFTIQKLALVVSVISTVASTMANFFCPRLITRFGAKHVVVYAMMAVGLMDIGFFFLSYVLDYRSYIIIMSVCEDFMYACAGLAMSVIHGGAMDYHTLLTGRRRESMFGSISHLPTTIELSILHTISLGILSRLGFNPEVNRKTGLLQNKGPSVMYLRIMATLAPAATELLTAVIMKYYHLDTAEHELVLDQLRRREVGEVFEMVDPLAPASMITKTESGSAPPPPCENELTETTSSYSDLSALDTFSSGEEEEAKKEFFMYFGVQELRMLTEGVRGLNFVLIQYLFDTVLSVLYLAVLMASTFRALMVAVEPMATRVRVRSAQNASQFIAAIGLLVSLLVVYQLGRVKGMMGLRKDSPDNIARQASFFLGKDRGTCDNYVVAKLVVSRVVLHGLSIAVVVVCAQHVVAFH